MNELLVNCAIFIEVSDDDLASIWWASVIACTILSFSLHSAAGRNPGDQQRYQIILPSFLLLSDASDTDTVLIFITNCYLIFA